MKCHKGMVDEEIYEEGQKCEDCVFQFICKKSDYQPVKQ